MKISILNRLFKVATAIAAFGVLALTNPVAASGPNLLVNGTFSTTALFITNLPDGWTVTTSSPNYAWANSVNSDNIVWVSPFETPDIHDMLWLYCYGSCSGSEKVKVAQQVNGLVPGHQYQLSYFTAGATWLENPSAYQTGPLVVSLGSQQAPPVVPPHHELYAGGLGQGNPYL